MITLTSFKVHKSDTGMGLVACSTTVKLIFVILFDSET